MKNMMMRWANHDGLYGRKGMSQTQKMNTLMKARNQFAGIGTHKAKLALNKLAKGDEYSRALRVALEIECIYLSPKRFTGGVPCSKKTEQIQALSEICKSQGWDFGVQQVSTSRHMVYFDIPGVGQLSWHYYSPKQPLPVYPGRWDGDEGSTLPKLEAAISALLTEAVATGPDVQNFVSGREFAVCHGKFSSSG